jgi:hypothetical protein
MRGPTEPTVWSCTADSMSTRRASSPKSTSGLAISTNRTASGSRATAALIAAP